MTLRNRFGAFPFALTFMAACTVPLAAQTTTPSTCTTPPAGVTSFLIEHAVDVTTIKTTNTPTLPDSVTGPIFSGAAEVRSRITYNSTTNIFQNDLFLVAPKSPLPTPAAGIPPIFGFITIKVEKISLSCQPRPTLLLTGTIAAGVNIFGPPAGAPYAFSFGYDINNTALPFRDIVSDSVGLGLLFADRAPGTITFLSPPVTPPPPTPGNAPMIVLSPVPPVGAPLQVFSNPYLVDASKSTSPSNLKLTYQWSSNNAANFSPSATDPTPLITLQAGKGDYTITLVVTDSAGASSTTSFTLEFLGR